MKKEFLVIVILVVVFIIGAITLLKSDILSRQYPGQQSQKLSYDPVDYTPEKLNSLIQDEKDKYVVIDVRSKLEYDKGHIPGALHADYYDTDALIEAAGDKIPIAYCSFSSMRGPYAAYELYKAGYKNASVLAGGLSAWTEDIQELDSRDPAVKTVFNHPKNIFPQRDMGQYPPNQGQVEISIIAKRFEFIPNHITVKHGQKVILHVKSIDVIHGFALPEFGIEEELLPNEEKEIVFTADRRGNFTFVCNVICGHQHSSMVGDLIVE